MTRAQWHRLHRWIAVTAGVFLFLQVLSGIVMVLPGDPLVRRMTPLDYGTATVSPAQAVSVAGEAAADPMLVRMAQRLVYRVETSSGVRLVDAHSGALFPVTLEVAEQIVRSEYAPPGTSVSGERIERREGGYRGPLPAFRIQTGGGVRYYVSPQDGSVFRSSGILRMRAAIESLHTFDGIPGLGGNNKLRKLSLLAAGMLGLGAIATGYWIAWRRRKMGAADIR